MKPLASSFVCLCVFTSKLYLVIPKIQRDGKKRIFYPGFVLSIVYYESLED